MAQPVPDNRPILSGGTSVGIIALLKTVANSTPTVATQYATSSGAITLGSRGFPNHIKLEPTTNSPPNAAIHGLRRPLASAMAPNAGDVTAIIKPAAAVAKPHRACPRAGSAATWVAK